MISNYKIFFNYLKNYDKRFYSSLSQLLWPLSLKKYIPCAHICSFNSHNNALNTNSVNFEYKRWLSSNILSNSNLYNCNKYICIHSKKLSSISCFSSFQLLNHYRNIPEIYFKTIRKSKNFSGSQQTEAHFDVSAFNKKEKNFWESRKELLSDLEETKAKVKEKVGEIIERENIWTIPNYLCIGRIIMSPFLCYSVMSSHYSIALGMFVVAGVTDMLDGMIARKFPSQASRLGSFLDPLADKILISSLFLTLTYVGLIPFFLTGIIVYRDIAIIGGASYVRYKSLPPPHTLSRYFDATHATAQLAPTFISKMNTAIQLGLITCSLAAPVFGYTDHYLLHSLWFITGVTTLASGIGYIFSRDTYKLLSTSEKNTDKS